MRTKPAPKKKGRKPMANVNMKGYLLMAVKDTKRVTVMWFLAKSPTIGGARKLINDYFGDEITKWTITTECKFNLSGKTPKLLHVID